MADRHAVNLARAMTAPVRQAAHNVLTDVDSNRYDLATALERGRRDLGDSRDRALLGEIGFGVYRWRATLDHVISQLSSRALTNIDDSVIRILRVALYQLIKLDRIPTHAVVADAVALTRETGVSSASGFVNAVLRTYTERRRPISFPLIPSCENDEILDHTAAVNYLSVTLSHPSWLIERWLDRHGWTSTAAWVRFNNRRAPVTIRPLLNGASQSELTTRLRRTGVHTVATRVAQRGLIVTDGSISTAGERLTSDYIIQEEGAQVVTELVCNLIATLENPVILDLCAAPGVKTVGLACNGNPVRVVATDYRERRINLLIENLAQHNISNASVVQLNAEQPLPFTAAFDVILVDAPCSGLGILRRDPDIRWRRTAEELEAFSARQLRMLKFASEALRPRGWLVYSTCSTEPEETNAVIQQFLSERRDFHITRPPTPEFSSCIEPDGFLRTLPFRDGIDGFFAATLQKQIP